MLTFNQVCEQGPTALGTREGLAWLLGYAKDVVAEGNIFQYHKLTVQEVLEDLAFKITWYTRNYNESWNDLAYK